MDDFSDIKFELDPDIESQLFYRSDSETNLNDAARFNRAMMSMNEQKSAIQNRINNSIAHNGQANTNDWTDELLDYSSNIARQTQDSLGRIKNHFLKNGMKFDTDFRNHFLYIVNNR